MDAELPFRPGDVLADKYRLERLLGAGGMGVVFAATHLELERHVAIKLLRPEQCDDEGSVARFLLEARATARLNGPHVAKVLDVGRLESKTPFMVMDLLEGQNLQELIRASGPLSSTLAVDCLLEACEAVAEAHRAGILHRDLKPANLFLTRDAYGDPSIRVLDFGITKLLVPQGTNDVGLTDSRSMVGSPVYMSPEQMRCARVVDQRTDIWGLGTVLFELLTGRPVWSGPTLSDLCAQVTRDPCPNASELCPGIARDLSVIVERCLEKDPEARFQQVSDLALALLRFASARGRTASNRVLQLAGHQQGCAMSTTQSTKQAVNLELQSTGTALPATAMTPLTRRARRRLGPFFGAVLLLLVGGILVISLRRTAPSERPPAVATFAPGTTSPSVDGDDMRALPPTLTSLTAASAPVATALAPKVLSPASQNRSRAIVKSRDRGESKPHSTAPSIDPMSIRETTPTLDTDPMSIRK